MQIVPAVFMARNLTIAEAKIKGFPIARKKQAAVAARLADMQRRQPSRFWR